MESARCNLNRMRVFTPHELSGFRILITDSIIRGLIKTLHHANVMLFVASNSRCMINARARAHT